MALAVAVAESDWVPATAPASVAMAEVPVAEEMAGAAAPVAETAGAVMLIGTAVGGIPVSTTHTITGSILGVGATQRLSAVRWGLAGRSVWAWILTIPLSALIAALTWVLLPHG